jgi:hypothetical protein
MSRRTGLLVTLVVLVSGCVSDARPDDATCRAPSIELSVALSADRLTGDDLAVCRDQEVTIHVAPEVDGVLHIHGYDEHVPATTVSAGEPIDLVFTAAESGQFGVEFHPMDDPRGVEIGIFAVYEP